MPRIVVVVFAAAVGWIGCSQQRHVETVPATGDRRPVTSAGCPSVPIDPPQSPACTEEKGYPACIWQMPTTASVDHIYRKWRNTQLKHWWGSPKLVQTIVNSIALYKTWHPNQDVRVGDLDAPGPRHRYHRKGVDVDLYLPGAMRIENHGARRYTNNHDGKNPTQVTELQQRVTDLARALTLCAGPDTRIFYNDPKVIEEFNEWHQAQGNKTSFEAPMKKHNKLHEFHFHFTLTSL